MTNPSLANGKLSEGIALLPHLKKELHRKKDMGQGYVVILDFHETETIVVALEAAKSLIHAPELYEALKNLVEVCPCKNGCSPDDMTCATMAARAALAKAVQS